MPDNPTIEQQQALAERQHNQEIKQIIEVGQHEYGDARFDEVSQAVAKALGDRTNEFLAAARQFDTPHRIIDKLGNDPDHLERFAKLPTARMVVEMARLEAHGAPGGHVKTGADPLWKGGSLRGKVSDRAWSDSFGAELDDKAWSKEFERRSANRVRRR